MSTIVCACGTEIKTIYGAKKWCEECLKERSRERSRAYNIQRKIDTQTLADKAMNIKPEWLVRGLK